MPLVQGIKRINPLDLNKNVTIGIAFPLNSTNLFKGTQTIAEQAKANLLNILLTTKGERVNEPNFGVGVKHLLFEQNIDLELLQTRIENQVARYVPNINIKSIEASSEEHTVLIKIFYRSTLDGVEDNIQLNFR